MSGLFFMSPEDADAHRTAHKAASHSVNSLLHTLSQDDLAALGMILDSIAVADEPVRIASYMSGRITAVQEARFKICAACGENHDEQLNELVAEPPVERTVEDVPVPPFVAARRAADESDQAVKYTPIGSTQNLTYGESEVMKDYNLDDLRDENHVLVGFICLGCEMQYSTIQDRALKPTGVEGCSGCQQKAKFG